VCDNRFIVTMGSMCISNHVGVFTFICCQFCEKTRPYYTKQALPYTKEEGGKTQSSAGGILLVGV
jgi:hypothetical protein